MCKGFPDSSVGKESTCNAGDSGSISRSGRPAGEGIGYHSIFYSFACGSTNKESVCDAGDLGLTHGLGKSLEKGKATHSSILAWRARHSSWGRKDPDTTKRLSLW